MRITPLDVRKQEFRRSMRGLDAEEVYAFLATVADEYEAVLNDSKALKERLLELDDKVQEYRNMEKTLRNTLMTAERVNAESKENARREAGLIIKEAQIEAEKALRSVRSEQMTLRNSVRELKRQQESYLSRIKMLAEAHLKFIQSSERDLMEEEQAAESPMRVPEDRVPPAAAPHGTQEHKPVEIAGAEEFTDRPGEEEDFRTERNDRSGASAERGSAPFADYIPMSSASSQTARTEIHDEPLFPLPPAGKPETEDVPDLNDILERLAAKQKQMYTTAPAKGAGNATGKPEAAAPAPSKAPFGAPRKDPIPAAPHDDGEEWSLERLKRDILSGSSGDNEKA